MLAPTDRQLYVDALRPPPGYAMAEAIATTYTLDLTTMLGIPIALALSHLDARRLGQESAVALLEGIRRVSSKLTVFCNRGDIAAPGTQHALFGLLERVIVEVVAPGGGCLHAKLWLLRFEPEGEHGGEPCMRLLVLSRNLTADRCWDVSLVLEGRITGRARAANRPLCELLEALPRCAARDVSAEVQARVERLADQARRTEWELPPGFEEIRFHALGLGKRARRWLPDASDRLLVVSPFVRGNLLQELVETTREPVALVARAEELDLVDPEVLSGFGRVLVLNERAEVEDGEDPGGEGRRNLLRGLHAKVYVAKRGWDTHVWLGSANATDAALLHSKNMEILAELVGKTSKLPGRGIDGMLSLEGLGAILTEYAPSPAVEVDAPTLEAERALDAAAAALASARLVLRFEERSGEYGVVLAPEGPVPCDGIAEMRAWLVTVDPSNARDMSPLGRGEAVELTPCSAVSATGLVAFELRAAAADLRRSFVLNAAVEQLPADRDARIVRMVLDNKERFLAYLLALLDGMDADALAGLAASTIASAGRGAYGSANGLLERLVRARARDPKRLLELRDVVNALLATADSGSVMPQDFLEVWNALSPEEGP